MKNVESLSVSGKQFLKMRCDADKILQKLFENMVKKESEDGEITIKINIKLIPEFVDAGIGNSARKALKPSFAHKITSAMKYTDSADGKQYDDLKEMVYDEERGEYVSRYIEGAEQMNLFEGEMGSQILPGENTDKQDGEADQPDQSKAPEGVKFIEGATVPQLPIKDEEPESEEGVIDAEYREVEENTDDTDETPEEANEADSGSSTEDEYEGGFESEYENFNAYEYEDPSESGEASWQ